MKLFLNQRFKFTLGSQYHLLNKWSFPHLYKLHHISVSSFIFPFICSHMKYYITSYNTVLYYVSLVIWLFLSTCYVVSDSLQPHELQHARPLCLSLSPGVCSNSCPLSQWCHSTIYPLPPLSPSALNLPIIRVFSNKSALRIRWPKY